MARGIKAVELNKRDKFVLFLLDKFRVLDTKSISILADFPSESYCSTRLQKLARYGYINREKLVNTLPLVHWLTQKGNDEINDKRTKHKPRLATLEHELIIGHVACFLHLHYGAQPKKIITDRELRQYEREVNDVRVMEHKGDLLFFDPQSGSKIVNEIELTFKGKSRTIQNIRKNARFSDSQVMEHKGDLLFFDPQSGSKIVNEIELTFKGKSRTIQNIRKNARFSDSQLWFIRKTMRGLENTLISQGISKGQIVYLDTLDLERRLDECSIDMDIAGYSSRDNIASYFKRADKPSESRLDKIAREHKESTNKPPQEPKKGAGSFFDRFR